MGELQYERGPAKRESPTRAFKTLDGLHQVPLCLGDACTQLHPEGKRDDCKSKESNECMLPALCAAIEFAR